MMWSFKGSTDFLDKQAERFQAGPQAAGPCKNNAEMFKCATLLAQLSDRQKKALRDENGEPVFGKPELDGIKGALVMVELTATRLHILAGAAHAMLAEAYVNLKIEEPPRHFAIFADSDGPQPIADDVAERIIAAYRDAPAPVAPPAAEDFADEILRRLASPQGDAA